MNRWLLLFSFVALALSGCEGCGPSDLPQQDAGTFTLSDGFEKLVVVDDVTLELHLSRPVNVSSTRPSSFSIHNFTQTPSVTGEVLSVDVLQPELLRISVSPLQGGQTYTLTIDLVDQEGAEIVGTLNFLARGGGARVPIRFVVDNPQVARAYSSLSARVSVDDETGAFSERFSELNFQDDGSTVYAIVEILVDPNRTLSTLDDRDGFADRRAFAVQVLDDEGRPASALTHFEVPSADAPRDIVLVIRSPPEDEPTPEPEPEQEPMSLPEDDPEDGLRTLRVVVNDGAAQALSAPQLKLSFDENGEFDASFSRVLPMTRMAAPFEEFWELIVEVRVDANRVLDGETLETFPYFAYLVASGTDYEALSVSIIAPDETPGIVELFLGNPNWTPVSFRVDVGGAYLNPTGSRKGLFDGEAVFLTGEWQSAVDALGNNCGDAFSGGEQRNLRMRPVVGKAGVWERTIWLPPGRPYGWKVVRCDAELGCGVLNQFVNSAGRAFATVMKNLATDNVDAFADPQVGIVDPLLLQEVEAAGQIFDYTNATVHVGEASGGEQDPEGTPDGVRLFKQEAPDLVVVVGAAAVKTRVYSVGTWRDVNLGLTPQEVMAAGELIELTLFDYDDGFIGRYPPSRENP